MSARPRQRTATPAPQHRESRFYVTLLTALESARNRIWLSTGFFVPTHQERQALSRAARRGADVRLPLPSFSDAPTALAAGHAAYDDLLRAGVRILEVRDAVLRSKAAAVEVFGPPLAPPTSTTAARR